MATNNAMEILAVTEALANIPDGMHVWIMTDSAYVKNGITQWVPNWIRNGWKNAGGARVSNKSLWDRLIAAVGRMRRVEWSWVKAHNGRLLNECADTLATKGVRNEPRPCPVATVRVAGEDTDETVYELRDGEETPTAGKDGAGYPTGRTYVLKAHAADDPFRADKQSSQVQDETLEQRIEENLQEIRDLSTPRVPEIVRPLGQTDSEDENVFPMPEEPQESSSPQYETGDAVVQKAQRVAQFWTEQVEWETRPKPEWWSQTWEELAEVRRADSSRIPTGSPKEFKECIVDDVFAMDTAIMQLREADDSDAIIDASVDPDLINVASAGIWNEHGSTLLRKCDRGHDLNDLTLSLFKDVLLLTPDNRTLTYATGSEWLIEQWTDMLRWKSIDYKGLDREACPYQWKGIMEHVETRLSNVTLVRSGDTAIEERIRRAVTLYGHE
jgi:ribonuclease HI